MLGTLSSVVVNRLLGCAHGELSLSLRSAIGLPCQSTQPVGSSGGSGVRPSHQTSPFSAL